MIKSFLRQAGFTMIELLVVIAVLGILATAVLSAINPIEQINKGRDTGHRSDAEQLLSAVDRYFALHELYPWNDHLYNMVLVADQKVDVAYPDALGGGGASLNCPGVVTLGAAGETGAFCMVPTTETTASTVASCNGTKLSTWMCALSDTAELKDAFLVRLRNAKTGNELYVTKASGATGTMRVCFMPQSNGFRKEAIDACKVDCTGGVGSSVPKGACPGACTASVYAQSADKDEMICL